MKDLIIRELESAQNLLTTFLNDQQAIAQIERAATVMIAQIKAGGKIIACGNGGSHCDAMHFAEEMTGRFREDRKALPAVAISDASHITCAANDYGFEQIFSRYIEALGQPNDVVFTISTSGNSENILKAAKTASSKGMKVVGLTGHDGGKLANLCDVEIRVPFHGYSDRIQEIHIKVIHILIMLIEEGVK
ncbi:MAG: D-sedoheptulose 7-phosphate isomerase [Marinoscillum sp.]